MSRFLADDARSGFPKDNVRTYAWSKLALAVAESALARRIVERALKNMPRYAQIYAPADGFVLKQTGESLHLRAKASSPHTFAIEDVSQPRNKFDSPDPGLSRLIIRLKTPKRSAGWISVTGVSDSPR